LGLRAVVFDYGMVLTGVPDLDAHDAMIRITGLPADRFESLYWTDRHAYDEGKLTGIEFWRKLVREAGLPENQKTVEELNDWDARMWTTENPAMLEWQLRLKERGVKTAILSNMGDNVLERIEREFDWIHRFDVLVWSFQLHMAKPDPAIYHYTLDKLGTQPEETLFLDDKLVNVEAANAMGMKAFQFSDVDRLRRDLIEARIETTIPLP
jgi:putative hydrolase of the HAD superfamily